jgi:hypothetical protein
VREERDSGNILAIHVPPLLPSLIHSCQLSNPKNWDKPHTPDTPINENIYEDAVVKDQGLLCYWNLQNLSLCKQFTQEATKPLLNDNFVAFSSDLR